MTDSRDGTTHSNTSEHGLGRKEGIEQGYASEVVWFYALLSLDGSTHCWYGLTLKGCRKEGRGDWPFGLAQLVQLLDPENLFQPSTIKKSHTPNEY